MATGSLRREVLQSFKDIHRARCIVFGGDVSALSSAREKINDHYRKNIGETDETKIRDLIKFAYEVIHELKSNVVQFKEVQPGRYQAQVRPEMFVNQTTKRERKRVNKNEGS